VDWQLLGLASGAVLLGAASLQAVGAAYAGRRRRRASRRRYGVRQAEFKGQFQAVFQWARASKPAFQAWSGARAFRVSVIVDEALDCKSFYLAPVDGRPLPRFEPGQYLTFRLPIDPRQQPLVRCYSISERPREDYYRVTIKREGAPSEQGELPPGRGSSYFHDRVHVGSTLQVQSPQGAFFLDPTDESPVVLVGAGIGTTPILSMVNSIVHQRSARTVYLFGGFGNSREHPFRERFTALAELDNLHVDVNYSRPTPADKLGCDYHHRGRIDVARLRQVLPSNNFRFYVCGPAAMMESLVPALLKWGIPESHIHFEAFGPASVKVGRSESLDTGPCNVKFSCNGQQLHWTGEHSSLLDFAEEQGISLDFGCRAGNCGQCIATIREGKVTHAKTPGLPVNENQCLTCIGVPQGDVDIDV